MSLTLSPTRPLAVEDSNLPDLVLVILGRPVWRARGLRLRREREELGRLAFCGFGEAHEYRHHGLPTSAEIIELRVGEARQEIWSMRPPRLVMADETLALTVAQPRAMPSADRRAWAAATARAPLSRRSRARERRPASATVLLPWKSWVTPPTA